MFRFNYLAILAVLISNLAFSQAEKTVYGKITKEDLSRKSYPVDSTAECITLYEKGVSSFKYDELDGLYIETDIYVRKRILKATAIDQGSLILRYVSIHGDKATKYQDIKASSYWLENGEVKKMDLTKKDIFDERLSEYRRNLKVTIPMVKEGGIIEYKYTKKMSLNLQQKPDAWYFQHKYPCLWSEYEIDIPDHLYYQFLMSGYLPVAINETEKINFSYGQAIKELDTIGERHTWAVKNAPAFKEEPFITTDEDYLSKIEFQLSQVAFPAQMTKTFSTSWSNLAASLSNNDAFGGRLKNTNYLKTTVSQFNGINDKKEKLEKVFDYLKRQFVNEDADYSIACSNLKKVFENKKGSSSEINMILTALLREMKYDANPVILSTRNNGRLRKSYPLVDKFNYVIVQVKLDDKVYLLDASKKDYSFNILPFECLNEIAFVINENYGEFANISPVDKNKKLETIIVDIDVKNNKLSGKYACTGNGYYALEERIKFNKIGNDKYKENVISKFADYRVNNLENINFEKTEGSCETKFDFIKENDFEESDRIYIDPILFTTTSKNPFVSEQRTFPIDFGYNYDHVFLNTINIPMDYEVESLPKNTILITPDKSIQISYSFTFIKEENVIKVSSRFITKKTMHFSDNYLEIKEFYKLMIDKQNEKIVLKRISPVTNASSMAPKSKKSVNK